METTEHYRTQEWRVYPVDLENKPFLPRLPLNPQTKPVGNSEWCKRNCEHCPKQDEEDTEQKSCSLRHDIALAVNYWSDAGMVTSQIAVARWFTYRAYR